MTRPAVGPLRVDRWQPALWVALAVAAAVLAGFPAAPGGSPVPVLVGTSITRGAMDVAGVACVGLALLGVLLPARAALPGGEARALARVQALTDRALVIGAASWTAVVLLGSAVRAADAFGRTVVALSAGEAVRWATQLAAGRGMILTAGCAAVVLGCAIVRTRDPARIQARVPLIAGLLGVLSPTVTGHAGSAPDHQLAVITVALHAGAAAMWVGGLGAVLVLVARRRALLDAVLPRFSRTAGACLVTVGATGLVGAVLRMGSWAALAGTPYGRLVLAKTGCLVLLAGLGGLARRRLAAGRTPVLRWAGVEVALMAVTLGLAAALAQTAG